MQCRGVVDILTTPLFFLLSSLVFYLYDAIITILGGDCMVYNEDMTNNDKSTGGRIETDTEIILRYAYFDGEKRAIAERHYTKTNK